MNSIMLSFLKKFFLFLIPFLLLFFIYLIWDPFMVLYDYDHFNREPHIHKNRDYVSTEMFIKNSGIYEYDSYILGASNSRFIPPGIWRNYIDTENNIFSFDASGENIVGIWSKIKYLQAKGHNIKNALVVIDPVVFDPFINNMPIFMKHYEVYPSSKYYFQYAYFLQFLNLRFIISQIQYMITGRLTDKFENVFETTYYYNDVITNEFHNVGVLNELKTDSLGYYKRRKDKFVTRTGTYSEGKEKINEEHVSMLTEIKDVFEKNNTEYRVIITPIYDQIAYNRHDKSVLQNIFGEDYVFDFSGINEITQEMSNYYDTFHFKQYIGKRLLDSAYSESPAMRICN